MVRDQLFSFYEDDEVWCDTYFYAPSKRMLERLSSFSRENFWSARLKISKVSLLIREKMFCKLTVFWHSFKINSLVHKIHPQWCFHRLSRISYSRYSSSLFYKCALNRAPCKDVHYRIQKSKNTKIFKTK